MPIINANHLSKALIINLMQSITQSMGNQWNSNVQQAYIPHENTRESLNNMHPVNVLYNPPPTGSRKQVNFIDRVGANTFTQQNQWWTMRCV